MKNIQLYYGMKILFPAYPITHLIPVMGIAITSIGSNDETELTEFTIERYWPDDTNANSYKVKLIPTEKERFGVERMYSSDLTSSLNRGHGKVIDGSC